MKKGIALVAVSFFMMLPSALSLSCNLLSGNDLQICNTLANSNLADEEKELLLNLGIYKDRTIPNHDFAYYWNARIDTSNAPYGTALKDEGAIKGAWLKILSIMPSVLENNTLYCDKQGIIQIAYNYGIQIRTGTASGDCRTDYSLTSQNSDLNLYLNSIFIGKEKLNSFSTSGTGDMLFTAVLNIEAKTKADHYQEHTYCCRRSSSGRCKRYCTECIYANTETITDTLTLKDSLQAKRSNTKPAYNFSVTDRNSGVLSGTLFASNYTSLVFNLGNSLYKRTKYTYDFVYSLKPYDIITIRATPLEEKETRNIKFKEINNSGFEFNALDSKNCSIILSDHFNSNNISCLTDFTSKNISIKTDKLHYFDNETIKVSIEPKNTFVLLTYGEKEISTKNEAVFTADPKANRVLAKYESESSEAVVSVTNKNNLLLASRIFLFLGFNYVLFSFLTKSWNILQWVNVAS